MQLIRRVTQPLRYDIARDDEGLGTLPGLVVQEALEAGEAEEAGLLALGVELDGGVRRRGEGVLEEACEVGVFDSRCDFCYDSLDLVRVEGSTSWIGPLER